MQTVEVGDCEMLDASDDDSANEIREPFLCGCEFCNCSERVMGFAITCISCLGGAHQG